MTRNNAVHTGAYNVCELLKSVRGSEEHWSIDPMLRRADKGQVSAVLDSLMHHDIKPYVSGGVFDDYVFGGRYGDVDLLGVFKNVADAHHFRGQIDTSGRVNPQHEMDPVYEATIEGSKFLVRDHKMRKAYFGILGINDVAMYFTLTPVVGKLEGWFREQFRQEKATIELGLTSVEHFNKSFGSGE